MRGGEYLKELILSFIYDVSIYVKCLDKSTKITYDVFIDYFKLILVSSSIIAY
jgi:hypothetical protein